MFPVSSLTSSSQTHFNQVFHLHQFTKNDLFQGINGLHVPKSSGKHLTVTLVDP